MSGVSNDNFIVLLNFLKSSSSCFALRQEAGDREGLKVIRMGRHTIVGKEHSIMHLMLLFHDFITATCTLAILY